MIEEKYEKTFSEIKEAAENAYAEQREETEEFPVRTMEGRIVPVRSDQSVLSFYEVTSLYYPGAAHGITGYSGYNYKYATGERITLADVFKDPAALKPVVAKYLAAQADGSPVEDAEDALQYYFDEGNMDDLTWVIDQDGVTFLFAPSDIAPYAMGTLEARIYFEREPSLFTGNYGPSKEGYVKPLSPYMEMTVDLDGMPAPLTDLYEIDADITLTTLVPVKAEVVDLQTEEPTGEEKKIPVGTKLNFWRTNGTDTVDMRTDDMEVGEAFRFKVETGDSPSDLVRQQNRSSRRICTPAAFCAISRGAHLVLARRCTPRPTINRVGASYSIFRDTRFLRIRN